MITFIRKSQHHQQGMSLVSLLVALGISGVIAAAMGTLLVNSNKATKHTEREHTLENLRQVLQMRMSCKKTQNQCTAAGTFVNILDDKDRVVFATAGRAGGFKVGEWNLRVPCTGPKQLALQYARLNGTSFAKDPLTGKLERWRRLFATGSGPCDANPAELSGSHCPPGKYASGYTADKVLICRKFPSCDDPGEIFLGVRSDGQAICRKIATCPVGTYLAGPSATGNLICKTLPTYHIARSACQLMVPGYDHCACPTDKLMVSFEYYAGGCALDGICARCTCCDLGQGPAF